MKKLFYILIILLNINAIFSTNFTEIDSQSKTIPSSLKTAEQITQHLTQNLSTPTEKVRAIYSWIAYNIKYDVAKLDRNNIYFNSQELVDEVLKTRKGVCANYAQLMQSCCQLVAIQCYVINGYTLLNGEIGSMSHAWNAVKIGEQFYNIDVTWAAGYVDNGKYVHAFKDEYFMILPSEFIKTHVPFDPIWQFSTNPITHRAVEKRNYSNTTTSILFNFNDSISVLEQLNSQQKTERENLRINWGGVVNPLIKAQFTYNQMLIENYKYNQIVEKLQMSQDLINKSIVDFNAYIVYKNKQFENMSLEDAQIIGLLNATRIGLENAEKGINGLYADKTDFKNSIKEINGAIKNLKSALKNEELFMEKYINTAMPLRKLLFEAGSEKK